MEIKKVQYTLPLSAVRVTNENMVDVATWCGGEVEISSYEKDSCVLVDGDCGSAPAFVGWWIVWDERKKTHDIVTNEVFERVYKSIVNLGEGN